MGQNEDIHYIYISGPLTTGHHILQDMGNACDMATELMIHGYAVYLPHLSVIWSLQAEHSDGIESYEPWMRHDFSWIMKCDAILRMKGDSRGADREVDFAKRNLIPVFYSIDDLDDYFIYKAEREEDNNV